MSYQAEYNLIKGFYGKRCAERSGLPLIQHIDEGLKILDWLGAADYIKGAFCLHPMLQADADYKANIESLCAHAYLTAGSAALTTAIEYRQRANAYLCKPSTDDWTQEDIHNAVGVLFEDMRFMLTADKVQNKKDFMLYHHGQHARSDQLLRYFDQWMEYLNFDYEVGKGIIYAG
jgi:hypothetical protein